MGVEWCIGREVATIQRVESSQSLGYTRGYATSIIQPNCNHNFVFRESTRNRRVLIDRYLEGNNQPKFPKCVKERFCGKPIMSCDVSFIVLWPVASFFGETNEIEQEGICVANNTITFSNGSSTINCDTVQND